jgi:hypothetical protein
VRFWGKVRGLQRDYLICQGTIDEMGNVAPFDTKRVTFKRSPAPALSASKRPTLTPMLGRSTDGVVWTNLEDVDEATAAKCAQINELFTGDLGKVSGADGEEGGGGNRSLYSLALGLARVWGGALPSHSPPQRSSRSEPTMLRRSDGGRHYGRETIVCPRGGGG